MKKLNIIILASIFSLLGCEVESEYSSDFCTLLGWSETLIIEHIPQDTDNLTKIRIDGLELENCNLSYFSCISNIEMIGSVERVTISLPAGELPNEIDLDIVSINASDGIDFENNYVNQTVNWSGKTYPNGGPECGVASKALIDLVN